MPLGYCQEANCIFIKNSTCKCRCCLFWRRVWDSPVCGRSGAAEKQSTGLFFNTRPSNPFDNITKKQHLHKTDAAYFGGGCGIRTHVGLLPNGFQDRLVMTASITLRMTYPDYLITRRRICQVFLVYLRGKEAILTKTNTGWTVWKTKRRNYCGKYTERHGADVRRSAPSRQRFTIAA